MNSFQKVKKTIQYLFEKARNRKGLENYNKNKEKSLIKNLTCLKYHEHLLSPVSKVTNELNNKVCISSYIGEVEKTLSLKQQMKIIDYMFSLSKNDKKACDNIFELCEKLKQFYFNYKKTSFSIKKLQLFKMPKILYEQLVKISEPLISLKSSNCDKQKKQKCYNTIKKFLTDYPKQSYKKKISLKICNKAFFIVSLFNLKVANSVIDDKFIHNDERNMEQIYKTIILRTFSLSDDNWIKYKHNMMTKDLHFGLLSYYSQYLYFYKRDKNDKYIIMLDLCVYIFINNKEKELLENNFSIFNEYKSILNQSFMLYWCNPLHKIKSKNFYNQETGAKKSGTKETYILDQNNRWEILLQGTKVNTCYGLDKTVKLEILLNVLYPFNRICEFKSKDRVLARNLIYLLSKKPTKFVPVLFVSYPATYPGVKESGHETKELYIYAKNVAKKLNLPLYKRCGLYKAIDIPKFVLHNEKNYNSLFHIPNNNEICKSLFALQNTIFQECSSRVYFIKIYPLQKENSREKIKFYLYEKLFRLAFFNKSSELIKILSHNKNIIDINKKNVYGLSMLDVALLKNNRMAIMKLKKFGAKFSVEFERELLKNITDFSSKLTYCQKSLVYYKNMQKYKNMKEEISKPNNTKKKSVNKSV